MKRPKCGTENPDSAKFGNECAYDLRKGTEGHPGESTRPQSYTPKYLADKILSSKSTINQSTGHGVKALFGAPLALENHARNARQAALAIQAAMSEYSQLLETKYDVHSACVSALTQAQCWRGPSETI